MESLIADRLVIDRNLRVKIEKYDDIKLLSIIKISRLDGCNFKRVRSLEFDFYYGACNTYNFEVEKILFCFGFDNRDCHL